MPELASYFSMKMPRQMMNDLKIAILESRNALSVIASQVTTCTTLDQLGEYTRSAEGLGVRLNLIDWLPEGLMTEVDSRRRVFRAILNDYFPNQKKRGKTPLRKKKRQELAAAESRAVQAAAEELKLWAQDYLKWLDTITF